MSNLIDEDGIVHERSAWSGGWKQKLRFFGPEKDVNIFGQPNVQRDFFGRPVQERGFLGTQVQSLEGKDLFRSSSTTSSGGGGFGGYSGAGDDLAVAIALGIFVIGAFLLGAVISAIIKLLSAIFNGYIDLIRHYPRVMALIHIAVLMAAVYFGTGFAGFGQRFQISATLLVPALWGWIYLTRHLPLIFMTINTVVIGVVLWVVAQITRVSWESPWTEMTVGLPFVRNLAIVLAIFPLLSWLLIIGARRWPKIFGPFDLLVLGSVLSFLLMRVVTVWQPYWAKWFAPVPFLVSGSGWLILFTPILLWIWINVHYRWPLIFTGINLLIFGGLLGLTGHHTQHIWTTTWNRWMDGLPFVTIPILVISLSPFTLWSWTKATQRWYRYLIIPNLFITGAMLYLIFDRTRSIWGSGWDTLWGHVPIQVDLPILLFFTPFAIWCWIKGRNRWPDYWGAVRASMMGLLFWWIVMRTQSIWQMWTLLPPGVTVHLASVMLFIPLLLWAWWRLRKKWETSFDILANVLIGVLAWLYLDWLLPQSTLLFRSLVAGMPLIIYGWLFLLRKKPIIFFIALLSIVVILFMILKLTSTSVQEITSLISPWIASQGIQIK